LARDGAVYVCQSCGSAQTKWAGQCAGCGAWNALVEEAQSRPPGALAPAKGAKARGLTFEGLEDETLPPPRIATGVDEFDRVCGGGVVPGSAILLGGDPGVGKSTLLLQVAGHAARRGVACAYISGEEAVEQVRGRAQRMGLGDAPVKLAAETSLRAIAEGLKREKFDLVVIDSIQTMWSDAHEAGPGSVTQVRAAAGELVRLAKKYGVAVILVGHVTKEGAIAGPRVIEHMVDAVFAFEGERGYPFRILRGAKNRFGATDEIGVFEMGDAGLAEVKNPSALFLNTSGERAAGAAVFAGIEGSRPVLVEFQALVAPSAYGTPGGPSSAGIPGASPWCWPCWKPAAASPSATATSTSTSPAACASPNRPPTWRPPRRWPPPPSTRPCRRTAWCSARSACRARSAPSAAWIRA
jgi:DNA repair protein RadA/Sms